MPNGYQIVVPFDTDDPEFTRGVEVGALWARLQTASRPFTTLAHASNHSMVMRLAAAAGCVACGGPVAEGWCEYTLYDAPGSN